MRHVLDGPGPEEIAMPFDGSRLSQEARLLITARARISEDGWCQRAFRDGKDQWCLMAALGYDGMLVPLIRSRKSYRYRALERVIEAISHHDKSRRTFWSWNVVGWNDSRKRTKEDVLDVLDRAIALS
jgi:hypothetical protein